MRFRWLHFFMLRSVDRQLKTNLRQPIASSTAGYLVGGIVVAIALGGAIDAVVTRYWLLGGRVLAGAVALAIFFASARAWGRRVADLAGGNRERAERQSALFVALPLIAAGGGL